MTESERLVEEAAARGSALSLTVDELGPKRVLEILAGAGSSHRVEIEGPSGCITVEVGNGLVVGAKAELAGEVLGGEDAYSRIHQITSGDMRITPLRFPSLANILEPIAQLLDPAELSGPALPGEDTIELTLPEARPFHPPPIPTAELRFEDETVVETVVELVPEALAASRPPPIPAIARAPTRHRGVALIAAVALVVGAVGISWSIASPGDAELETLATLPTLDVSTHLTTEVDMDFREPLGEPDSDASAAPGTGTPSEARQLARSARARLRSGDAPGALAAARRAAQIRGGRPYYQVLLGDALRADGRRAAAHRAYRRAVRLRPGYRPAMRRLQRRRASAARRNATRS